MGSEMCIRDRKQADFRWTSAGNRDYKLAFMTDKRARETAPSGSMPATTAPPAGLTSRHLLGIEGLNPLEITSLIDRGNSFADIIQNDGRFEPPLSDVLRGRTVLNLFFENSTRTRVSFELAAKNLGGSS